MKDHLKGGALALEGFSSVLKFCAWLWRVRESHRGPGSSYVQAWLWEAREPWDHVASWSPGISS